MAIQQRRGVTNPFRKGGPRGSLPTHSGSGGYRSAHAGGGGNPLTRLRNIVILMAFGGIALYAFTGSSSSSSTSDNNGGGGKLRDLEVASRKMSSDPHRTSRMGLDKDNAHIGHGAANNGGGGGSSSVGSNKHKKVAPDSNTKKRNKIPDGSHVPKPDDDRYKSNSNNNNKGGGQSHSRSSYGKDEKNNGEKDSQGNSEKNVDHKDGYLGESEKKFANQAEIEKQLLTEEHPSKDQNEIKPPPGKDSKDIDHQHTSKLASETDSAAKDAKSMADKSSTNAADKSKQQHHSGSEIHHIEDHHQLPPGMDENNVESNKIALESKKVIEDGSATKPVVVAAAANASLVPAVAATTESPLVAVASLSSNASSVPLTTPTTTNSVVKSSSSLLTTKTMSNTNATTVIAAPVVSLLKANNSNTAAAAAAATNIEGTKLTLKTNSSEPFSKLNPAPLQPNSDKDKLQLEASANKSSTTADTSVEVLQKDDHALEVVHKEDHALEVVEEDKAVDGVETAKPEKGDRSKKGKNLDEHASSKTASEKQKVEGWAKAEMDNFEPIHNRPQEETKRKLLVIDSATPADEDESKVEEKLDTPLS